ncbi:MAG: prepilin peptidase [Alphaproteobacteria bacterium]|jgi:prepilin signal peptidase PulO-like enzyme (type II secretory pathway)
MLEILILLTFVVFSLGFAAFNTTLYYRLPNNIPLAGKWSGKKPYCEKCGYILKPLDYFPLVNWLVHSGKCRGCKKKLDLNYFYLELSTFVVYLSIFFIFNQTLNDRLIIVIASINFLIVAFFCEKTYKKIPEKLLLSLLICGIIFRILKDAELFPLISSLAFSLVVSFFVLKKMFYRFNFPLYYYQLTAISGAYFSTIEFMLLIISTFWLVFLLKIVNFFLQKTGFKLIRPYLFSLLTSFAILIIFVSQKI